MLHGALTKAGASSQLVPVTGESHTRVVLALSHPGKAAAPAVVEFVRQFSR